MSDERAIDDIVAEADERRDERWKRYDWQLLPSTPLDPVMQVALDETLTLAVGRGERQPAIRFWNWAASAIVLGRFQSVRNEVNEDAATREGITLVRRISGGGAMFIEPEGAITYSIYAPEDMARGLTFPESYAFFDSWVIDALRELGVNAWYAPLNDITSDGGKIGGAAQARRGGAILHHTTMAYQMNTDLMVRVLRIGKEKLSDKGVQSADKRVGPLRQQTDLDRDVIIHHLVGYFRARFGLTDDQLRPHESEDARTRAAERFGTREWLHILP
ncbi:MAG: lipoate--protein ligase family protein [Chloroflexota bacterium]|nr:lipoate--protein ligase family protein [Chloroflexota bacterium]